jgi:hypothetical protein
MLSGQKIKAICKGKPPINDINLDNHKEYRVKKLSFQAIIGKNSLGYWVLDTGYSTYDRKVKLLENRSSDQRCDRGPRFDISISVNYFSLTL